MSYVRRIPVRIPGRRLILGSVLAIVLGASGPSPGAERSDEESPEVGCSVPVLVWIHSWAIPWVGTDLQICRADDRTEPLGWWVDSEEIAGTARHEARREEGDSPAVAPAGHRPVQESRETPWDDWDEQEMEWMDPDDRW